nr:uncharacterized protein A4U43_C05F19340 [Ipomoea batatas]
MHPHSFAGYATVHHEHQVVAWRCELSGGRRHGGDGLVGDRGESQNQHPLALGEASSKISGRKFCRAADKYGGENFSTRMSVGFIRVVKHRREIRILRRFPGGGSVFCAVNHEEIPVGEDQQIPHNPPRRHLVNFPFCPFLINHNPAAILQRRRELPGRVLRDLEGFVSITAADQNLRLHEIMLPSIRREIQGEKRGLPRRRVVPGPAWQFRELPNRLSGSRVENNGAIVGEEENVAVGEKVHKWIQIILQMAVRGFHEQRKPKLLDWELQLIWRDKFIIVSSSPSHHHEITIFQHLLRSIPASEFNKRIPVMGGRLPVKMQDESKQTAVMKVIKKKNIRLQ